MDNIIETIMGMDKRKEILTLWYEVTYLRMIISHMMSNELLSKINLEEIKKDAQVVMRKRFPKLDLNFSEKIYE